MCGLLVVVARDAVDVPVVVVATLIQVVQVFFVGLLTSMTSRCLDGATWWQ